MKKNHFSNYVRRPKRGAISQDRDSNVGPRDWEATS